jgi:hydroxymethylbilane synthase
MWRPDRARERRIGARVVEERTVSTYPIALALAGKSVVVAGGGAVAERKVRGLLEAGARVTVVAPRISAALAADAERGMLVARARPFRPSDLDGAVVAFATTDDPAVNRCVVAAARERGVLVNDTTEPEVSDFANPLVYRSGPLTFSVDTGGLSPSFAKRLGDELAAHFDARYARAAAILGKMRDYTTAVVPPAKRAAVMRELAAREIDELAAMNPAMAENEVENVVEHLAREASGGQLDAPGSDGTISHAVVATRASALALWQTRFVMSRLAAFGTASTVLEISTKGDRILDRSLAALGTDSIFVKELELALREHRADYAVHSCKDLPSVLPEDMQLAAIGTREDPRDAFCSERYADFNALPAGATVGTSSPRRRAQLAALRPDLRFEIIRGNVDTRLRKLRDGEYDAIVLAAAGMRRLGLSATYTVPFEIDAVTPAVGQGALAIECRSDEVRLASVLRDAIGDERTHLCVTAERAFLRTFRAGCQAPLGGYAAFDGDGASMTFTGVVASLDGTQLVRTRETAEIADEGAADAFGERVARALKERGGDAILASNERELGPLHGRIFVLPRTQDRPSQIAPAFRDAGAEVLEVSGDAQFDAALGGRDAHVLLFPSSGSVAAIAGSLATLRERGARPIVAAMGDSSAAAAAERGFVPDVVAPEATVGAFVQSVTRYVLTVGESGATTKS